VSDERIWSEEPEDAEVIDGKEALPPDPAGTQPKVDRDALLPARLEEVEDPPLFRPPTPLPEPVAAADAPSPYEPGVEPPHAAKFQFILGALLAIGVVGLAALGVVLANNASKGSEPAWSAWKPSEKGIEGAAQIAEHVAPQYKLRDGKQMVAIKASALEAEETPLRVALRARSEEGGEITMPEGEGVLYQFCGLGTKCTIRGEPSEERALLLRREALEVALYSFRYLDVDQVVMFMPPMFIPVKAEGQKKAETIPVENQAMHFRRSDFEFALQAPLGRTLPPPTPAVQRVRKAPEAPLVENLAGPRSFTYSLVAGNLADEAFLVLEKLNQRESLIRQQELELERQKAAAAAEGGPAVEGTGSQ
jgi:hypothetical protein